MISKMRLLSLCAAVAVALPNVATAQYVEVFTEADVAGGLISPFLETVTVDNGIAYAVSRELGSSEGSAIAGGSVVSYDGSTFTTIMTAADWAASGSTFDTAAFSGTNVVGGSLRAISFFDNNLYDVDLTTGVVSEVVSAMDFGIVAGGAVNLSSSNLVVSDGSAFAYDGNTDSVYQVSSGGVVSTLISDTQLIALTGSDLLQGTGFALVGNDLYFGSNAADALYKWDIVAGSGSLVLDEAQLEALSNDIDGNAGIDDVFYAPNGMVYFYEDDADYIYKFDPSDPAGTLEVVLTEDELLAGPAPSDLAAQLTWWNGTIAWTDQSDGFYAKTPEPTTALLSLIGLVGFTAARRR